MGPYDWIIIALLFTWGIACAVFLRRRKKSGGCSGCGGNCTGCSGCSSREKNS